MTLGYRAACAAMEEVGRRYRVAFAINSLAGLIAISVLTRTAVPPDLHVVSSGLPPLPTIGIAVEFAEPRPSSTVRALGDHTRSALPTLQVPGAAPHPNDAATGARDRPM